jgi:hypothetical protein
MPEMKPFSLVRPTLHTHFHIDYDWWHKNDRDWRGHLYSVLCQQHKEMFSNQKEDAKVDWIDPRTAEVQRVDGIQHALITHCSRQEGFFAERITLVDAVFRLFLANGNTALSPIQMGEKLNRPPEIILRTLTGGRIYRGVRACLE